MSDLKITHAGTVQTQDRHGPMNPFAPFGQVGSAFLDNTSGNLVPPLGQVFVAITVIDDCKFTTLTSEDSTKYINTAAAAHGLAGGAATAVQGEDGEQVASADEFPAGITLYGRWTDIRLADGIIVAYIG